MKCPLQSAQQAERLKTFISNPPKVQVTRPCQTCKGCTHISENPKKAACRESEKSKRKLHAKVAKRAKLDPDTAQTALDVQQNGLLRVEDESPGGNEDLGDAEQQGSEKSNSAQVQMQGKALHLSNATGELPKTSLSVSTCSTASILVFSKTISWISGMSAQISTWL